MHKARYSSLILLLSLALCTAAQATLPAPVSKALQEAGLPQDAVAIYARRVDQDTPLISFRADQATNPASTMKLVTTYAGLDLLGPAYTWRTEIYADGEIEGEALDGNLVIKGYGDPALDLERFWNLLRSLRQKGLRDIRGDLVLDGSFFSPAPHDPGAFDGEPYRAYNAGPNALLVNYKTTRFQFVGDAASGKVQITADPDFPQMQIDNQLVLRQVPCADWKDRLGYRVESKDGLVVITFSGNYSLACGEKSLDLVVMDDASYILHLFKRFWREQGGSFSGVLRSGSVPTGAKKLLQAVSPPLAEVVRSINKYSNNLMARQLLLTIAAEQYGMPGSESAGARAVSSWLDSRGMRFPELVIENGSGLSRKERISAQHLGELLLHAFDSPVMPELMSSLPVVAVDGTLHTRMKESGVAGRAHLKTGSVNGNRALAGYLLDARGRRWVVVFMAAHPNAGASRAAQDALLDYLYHSQ